MDRYMAFTFARFNERLQTFQESLIFKRKKTAKNLTHINFYKKKKKKKSLLSSSSQHVLLE